MDNSYNGWANYQTWAVNLWLCNDEGTYEQVNELFVEGSSEHGLADELQSLVNELAEILHPGVIEGASFVADLLGHALESVNWRDIAIDWADGLGMSFVTGELAKNEAAE